MVSEKNVSDYILLHLMNCKCNTDELLLAHTKQQRYIKLNLDVRQMAETQGILKCLIKMNQ